MRDVSLERVPPEAFFVIGAISQYVGAAIAVHLFDDIAAGGVAWLRVLFAAAIVIGLRRSWRRPWTRVELRDAALFGTVLAAMNLCFYLAIDRLYLGTAVAIEFIGPIAVAATGTRTPRNAIALGLATAGVVLLAEVRTEGDALGLVFILLAAALWAGYILVGSRVAKSASALDGLGVGMAIGAVAIAPFGLADAVPALDRPGLLLLAAATGVLSSAVPYALDQITMRRLAPSHYALLLALLPVTATIVGMLSLDQMPSAPELAGIAIVVFALVVRDRATESVPV